MPVDHSGHRERLRRMFRENGLDHLEPHNALEFILTFALPRVDVNPLAHRLIDEFGSFDQVLDADYERLLQVPGVGENTAMLLKMLPATYRYYERQKNRETFSASSTEVVLNFARSLFVGETRELSYLLCFDTRLRLNRCAKVSEGSINATSVSVRRIVDIASANKALSVILAHNHPGGLAMPSLEDIAATRQIMHALHIIGIALVDHIVVGSNGAVSMSESSVLYNIRQELGI